MLDVSYNDKSNWEKEVEVTLSYEELAPDFEKAYKDYKKRISLEGFRKGKVPMDLVKKLYGKEIETHIAEEKIPEILEEIRDEKKLKLISPAKLQEFSYDKENGLKFKVLFEFVPEIELDKYSGLSLEKKTYEISDVDVEEALKNLQEQQATMKTVDEEAQVGHFIVADFQKIDASGVPIVGQKFENRFFQLNKAEGEDENQMTEQLLGVKAGDTRKVKFETENQKEQEQFDFYEVSVKEVKEKMLPEINDEFARDAGDYENLEDLKEKMSKELKSRFEEDYEYIFRQNLIDEVVKVNTFELPEPMIENYLQAVIEKAKEDSKGQGVDESQIRSEHRPDAIRQFKWIMIRDKVAELEDIKVESKEIDEYIEDMANKNENNRMQIINYYRQAENRDRLETELLEKKVANFIAEHSDVTEKKVTREDLEKKSNIIT
ncbi:trigger factor [candidate division KSB1 bacterium]|nr:trigger factor [candidate division KSB1 bacterium]